MPITVGEVEAILTARDQMSQTVLQIATRVAQLTQTLGTMGVTSVREFNSLNEALLSSQAALKSLTDAATLAAIQNAALSDGSGSAGNNISGLGIKSLIAAGSVKTLAEATQLANTSLEDTEKQSVRTGQSMAQLDGLATRMIERMLILYAIRGSLKFTEDIFEAADALIKLGQQTDMSLGKLQEIKYAADSTGTPFEKVATAIDTFDKKVAEAKATTSDALGDIGLSFGKLEQMAPDQRFDAVAAAIAALPTQLQRTKAEIDLFGTDAIDPFIKNLASLEKQARDTGAVLGDDSLNGLAGTIKLYRGWGTELEQIFSKVLDAGQRVAQFLASPIFTGNNLFTTDQFKTLLIMMASGASPIDAFYDIAQYATAKKPGDISLPPMASGSTSKMGWNFISGLQQKSDNPLTPDQLSQMDELRRMNQLTADNAVKVQDSSTGANVTTGQYREYLEQVKEWNKEASQAASFAKKWQAAMAELDAAGDGWRGTLLGIDGEVVEAVKYYLEAGVTQEKLALAYELTADQVKAVASALKDETAQRKELNKEQERVNAIEGGRHATAAELVHVGAPTGDVAMAKELSGEFQNNLNHQANAWQVYNQAVEKEYGDTIQFQILKIKEWQNIQEGQLNYGVANWVDAYHAIHTAAQAQIAAVIALNDPLFVAWKQLTGDMRKQWASDWDKAIGDFHLFIGTVTGSGQSFQSDFSKLGEDLVNALLSPFNQLEQRLVNILGASAASIENKLISGITGDNFAYPGANGGGGIAGLFGSRGGYSAALSTAPTITDFATGSYNPAQVDTQGNEASLESYSIGGFASIAPSLSKNIISGGAGLGATLGSGLLTAGISTAIAIGGELLIGGLKKLFADHTIDDIARDAGKDFGQTWSDSLLKEAEANAKKFGSEVAGELASLPDIIKEHPVTAANDDMYISKAHDLFSMIDQGHMTLAQVTDELQAIFPDLEKNAVDAYGRIDDRLKNLIATSEAFGANVQAITDFEAGQATNLTTGVSAVVAAQPTAVYGKLGSDVLGSIKDNPTNAAAIAKYNSISAGSASYADALAAVNGLASKPTVAAQQEQAKLSAPELGDVGNSVVGAYATEVATGKSQADALKDQSASLTTLEKEYKDLGLAVDDVALKNLFMQNDILTTSPALVAGIGGVTQSMIALDNMQVETGDDFAAQQRTAASEYNRLQGVVAGLGGTTKDALLPMQDYLHQAEIEAGKLGLPLDDNTQQMIYQSKELGIWKDTADKAKTPFETLIDKITDLINTLRGIPPVVHINTDYTQTGTPPIGTGDGGDNPGSAIPMASGGFGTVTKPTLFLAGEAGSEQFAFSGGGKKFNGAPSSGRVGSGGDTYNVYYVTNDINALDAITFQQMIAESGMPIIIQQIEDNGSRGYATRIKRSISKVDG